MSSAAVTPTKSRKKRAKSQGKKMSPSMSDLILGAASGQRGGVSLVAIKKALQSGGCDVAKNRSRLILAIRRLVANKSLVQIKGKGASGSFRLNKKPLAPKKKKVERKKKPKAKKVKSVRAKKVAAGASPAVKKAPKKKKSPKKPKRAAGAKKLNSPRKVRVVVRTTRSRAAAI